MVSRKNVTMVASVAVVAGLTAAALIASRAQATPVVGTTAPDFAGVDTAGQSWDLSDLSGQIVILEWTNHDCPYVRKHYDTGNMQSLQTDAIADGAVWLTVISSAPGKQGYVTATEADALTASRDAAPTAVLLDPSGEIGQLYGAQTTPHMYVIDEAGDLRYMGAIDDRPTANHADVDVAHNYLTAALDSVAAGDDVAAPVTKAYGCSVKYGS